MSDKCEWVGVMANFGEIWIYILLALITGGYGLKDISISVPSAVRVMDTVTLQCKYNLENEPLYTVKWYKGRQEFYRYIPKEMPSTQVFPTNGINVDLSKSTPNEVVLRNVQPEVSGWYRCEVSSDAPNFYTYMASSHMYVIEVPKGDPVMTVQKASEMGDTTRGNCTSPPTYPAANITWFLNGRKINESYVNQTQTQVRGDVLDRRRPYITHSSLQLEIDSNTFGDAGEARLQCVVTLFSVYRSEVDELLHEERPRPRPSSELRTRDASDAGGQYTIHQFLLIVAVFISLR